MPADGMLEVDRVVVRDAKEASALFAKGAFGEPLSGGALALTLLEAGYLLAEGRLRLRDADAAEVVARGAAKDPAFASLLAVQRDLRGRGLVLRRGEGERLLAYPRGGRPGKDAASEVVLALTERAPVGPGALLDEALATERDGRRFLAALTDEEGDVTYWKVVADAPEGSVADPAPPARAVAAALLADRVLVPEAPAALSAAGYGRDLGTGLELPLVDALHLAERGWVDLAPDAVRAAGRALAADFDLRAAVHRDLRARGLLVRTGLKFGTHFRAYRRGAEQEHAPWLVHALPRAAREDAAKVAGFVRLAHAVRKTLLFALVRDGGVDYVAFERTKP